MEEDPEIKDKLVELKQSGEGTAKLSADRLSLLEQAGPLAAHLHETHSDLEQWFRQAEDDIMKQDSPALNTEQIKEQQDTAKVLKRDVNDHKPQIDRLVKTGSALLKLVGDEDVEKLQDMMETDSARFDGIKNAIRERSNSLDEALQQTSEVSS